VDEIGDKLDEKHIMKASKIEIIIMHQLQIAKKIIKLLLHDIIHGKVIITFHQTIMYTDDYAVLCQFDIIRINEIY
jgi:hypothetical protein